LTTTTTRNYFQPDIDHYRATHSDPHHGHDLVDAFGPEEEVGEHSQHEHVHALENSSLSNTLFKEVRVLCWIMTNPANHKKKAMHVKRTWGKRCNKILFMSSQEGEFCRLDV
jgi:glycoprotein-N-acetylgalactosamine 3-beta-galactosyltransferase